MSINIIINILECVNENEFFYNTPMISARFHACGAGLQSRFSKGMSTN